MLWEVARFLSAMHCQQWRQIWAFRNIGFAQIACLSALCNEGELDTCQLKKKYNCCEWKAQQMNTYCKSRQGAEQACVCLLFGLAWGLDKACHTGNTDICVDCLQAPWHMDELWKLFINQLIVIKKPFILWLYTDHILCTISPAFLYIELYHTGVHVTFTVQKNYWHSRGRGSQRKKKKQWSKKNTMVNVNIATAALNKTPVKRQCRNTQKASTRGLQSKLKK